MIFQLGPFGEQIPECFSETLMGLDLDMGIAFTAWSSGYPFRIPHPGVVFGMHARGLAKI